jgi:hypothetical protein
MKAYWGVDVQLHTFLILALDGGEWSVSCLGCFTSQGKSMWYPLDRRLGGPRSQSGCSGEGKNSQSLLGLEALSSSL